MARIRTIKPSFFRHGDLFDAEKESGLPLRIAYAGLWTIADREGRFKWKPRDIRVEVLPYDDVDMGKVLDALTAKGFVRRYTVNGQEYGCIPAFLDHQHINKNEPASNIPAPPQEGAKKVRASSPHPKERKGKERKESISDADASFETFWNECPKKVGKAPAYQKWVKAIEKKPPADLVEAMRRYAASRADQDQKFTLQPATWLHQERWTDDLPQVAGGQAAPVDVARLEGYWGGAAKPLVEAIGPQEFLAWFGDALADIGPPMRIIVPKQVQRSMIERKYSSPLRRLYGEGLKIEVAPTYREEAA